MIAKPVACAVDASVGIKLIFTEVLSPEAHSLFAHLAQDPVARFVVPDLFDLECANVLWKHILRFGYPLADAKLNLATLAQLRLTRIPVATLLQEALIVAAAHGISVYDACYVVCAHRQNVPLITADARLVGKLAGSQFAVFDLAQLAIPQA